MTGSVIWHTALHEMRAHRRRIRTHVFVWVALLISTTYFLLVTYHHMQYAAEMPMLGVISPRYIIPLLGGSFLVLFCTGVLLLTFDHVKRDEITRIHEVVDCKPIDSIVFYFGRLLGVLMTMGIPIFIFLFSIVFFGTVAETFSFKFGEPIEIWSVVSFLVLDTAPNFLFFGSLVILFSSLFKSRLLAILLTLSCLITLFWCNSRLPTDFSTPLQTVSGNVLFPSELIPTIFTPATVFNRIALLLMSFGLLYWASYRNKRITPNPKADLVLGCSSFSLGVVVIGVLLGGQSFEQNRINQWTQFHDQHFLPNAFPDVHEIRGHIEIKPSRLLSLDLTLDVSIHTDQGADFVLFSLNPGYKISHLAVGGERVLDHDFRHGLLAVPQRYFTSENTEVEIKAKGRPDERFAYLDSNHTLSQIVGPDVQQLRRLGTENFIFRPEFVVLLPGIKWYPTSGTATNEEAWEQRKRDFFTVDIEVSVPRGWIVAGPAKRERVRDTKRTKFGFQQSSPLPDFALVGSRFESASLEVEGVFFEILYSKTHQKTFKSLARMQDKLRTRLEEMLKAVQQTGFNYPYGSFALVEVPSTLRVFGGGIGMNTVMCPPGLVMMRESTLPTIPTDSLIDEKWFEQTNLPEEERITWEFDTLSNYLQHSAFESNLGFGFFRSLVGQQTGATHNRAQMLNELLEQVTRTIFRPSEVDFAFHLVLDRNVLNLASVQPLKILTPIFSRRQRDISYETQRKMQTTLNAPKVWEYLEVSNPLETEFGKNRNNASRAMKIRAKQIVSYLHSSIGPETFNSILVDLTNRFRGRNFTHEDFFQLFAEHGVSLEETAGDMISKTGLPGFIGLNPTVREFNDEDQSKYETTFILQNDEPVSGPVRLSLRIPMNSFASTNVPLPTMMIAANQSLKVAIESLNPIQEIWLKPYLSKNRMNIRLDLPQVSQTQDFVYVSGDQPVVTSIEEVGPTQINSSTITVDDLDAGFSTVRLRQKSVLGSSSFNQLVRRFMGDEVVPLDNGLPIFQLSYPLPRVWARVSDLTAFGSYRRTIALSELGEGLTAAKFTATLPKTGDWKLEFFLPKGHVHEEVITRHNTMSQTMYLNVYLGAIDLEIKNGSNTLSQTLDTPNLDSGWITVGTYRLTEPTVDVLVPDKAENSYKKYVFADAIRWTPVEASE